MVEPQGNGSAGLIPTAGREPIPAPTTTIPAMPLTNTERQARWRARQKAGIKFQPLICERCARIHRGIHGMLCSRCWERLDPAGRAAKAERVRRSRAKAKAARDVM
jgi:hypothetical protein